MKKKIIEEIKNVVRGLNDISCVDCKSFNNFFGVCDENRKCDETIFDAVSLLCHFEEYYNKYRWHDLRKDHTDLPEVEGHFNVCVWLKPNDAWGIEESYIYDTQYFCERFQSTRMSEVIAWKEIEPFESEE